MVRLGQFRSERPREFFAIHRSVAILLRFVQSSHVLYLLCAMSCGNTGNEAKRSQEIIVVRWIHILGCDGGCCGKSPSVREDKVISIPDLSNSGDL